jgi:HemY protein
MKLIIVFIIALTIATGLAYQVHVEPGYALLTYGSLSVETSLAVLAFVTLVSFVLFYIVLRSFFGIKRVPKNIGNWNSQRKQNRSQKEVVKGLLDSAEGNWHRSEKLLTKHVKDSDTPLLNYLSAAHAAQSQGAYERRDEYLFQAGQQLPDQVHAIHLTRAKLQFSAGQFEQALATLNQLVSATPEHPVVLTLLVKTHLQLNDWEALYNLLPVIRKNRNLQLDNTPELEEKILTQLLSSYSYKQPNDIDDIWKSLSKKQRLEPQYLVIYAKLKISNKNEASLADLLIKSINSNFDKTLIALYQDLNLEPVVKIKQFEKWLKSQPNNISLLNAVSSLYVEQKDYEKAQERLERSISAEPSSEAYLLLGQLCETQGDTPSEKATEHYRAGLELANNVTPENPIVVTKEE